jgi:hypothetical protein
VRVVGSEAISAVTAISGGYMKSKKIDGKFRVVGETKIEHGARGGGVGKHKMSDGVQHVGHVPADVGQFDQQHGVAPGAGSKDDGE